MQEVIIIKYGELSTKKDNINYFLKILKENIELKLKDNLQKINYDRGRMIIFVNDFSASLDKLQEVFGLQEIVKGYQLKEKDFANLKEVILVLIKELNFLTFKVETKRSDKSYFLTSLEINQKIGAYILENWPQKKVEVKKPDLLINLEIRQDSILIYYEQIKGLGGYPVGTLGKGLLMLSGGIDSPLAGYLTIKRGVKLEAIYFESPPHTSVEAKNKVIKLAKILAKYNNDIKVHLINFTKIQEEIYKNIPAEYLITIMRRMMYRISEKIAKQKKIAIIVNGESIGQVASQTLSSLSVINKVVDIPVIRPVACFDKLEIIALAKKINTYETSILPFEDCCTLFVPKHPVINPELKLCEDYEKLIAYEPLIIEAIKTQEIIKVTEEMENIYQDLL